MENQVRKANEIKSSFLKRHSTPYVIKEKQIKRISYYYTPIRMAKIRKLTTLNAVGDIEQQKFLFSAGGNKNGTATLEVWKYVWQFFFFNKTTYTLTLVPEMVLLGVYSKELSIYVHTKTCTGVFIAALFIIAKIWKQSRCPSIGEWINCVTSRQWNIIQHWKGISLSIMKRHRGLFMHFTKCKQAIWKGYMLYESNYLTFQKKAKLRRQ